MTSPAPDWLSPYVAAKAPDSWAAPLPTYPLYSLREPGRMPRAGWRAFVEYEARRRKESPLWCVPSAVFEDTAPGRKWATAEELTAAGP